MSTLIYFIDSDETFTTQLKKCCDDLGVESVVFNDGKEGVKRAIADQPTAVVLGLMGEKRAGYALCGKLRRKHRAMPVILVIDEAEDGTKRLTDHRNLSTAANAYLKRPFSIKHLYDTLASLVPNGLPYARAEMTSVVGQVMPAEESLFGGLFDDQDDADIEAATDSWFDSIIASGSEVPVNRPLRPSTAPRPRLSSRPPQMLTGNVRTVPPSGPPHIMAPPPLVSLMEELELSLDELVPPADTDMIQGMQAENSHLRDRIAELEAEHSLEMDISNPVIMEARREALDAEQRLLERDRELVALRQRLTRAEEEVLELEESSALGTAERLAVNAQLRMSTKQLEVLKAESVSATEGIATQLAKAETQRQTLADEVEAKIKSISEELAEAKATALEDTQTLELMHEEANSELEKTHQAALKAVESVKNSALETLKKNHAKTLAGNETTHQAALAEMRDRLEVIESTLVQRDSVIEEYEQTFTEMDATADAAQAKAVAAEKALEVEKVNTAALESKVSALKDAATAQGVAHSETAETLAKAKAQIVDSEKALAKMTSEQEAVTKRLEAVLSQNATRDAAIDKVRTALAVAQAFIEHADTATV